MPKRQVTRRPPPTIVRPAPIGVDASWILTALGHISPEEAALVTRSLADATEAYRGKSHWSSRTLLEHAEGVARELLRFASDPTAVMACLLHHIMDEGGWTRDQVIAVYGEDVLAIVEGIHLLARLERSSRRMSIDSLRLMFLRITSETRVVLVLLCAKLAALRDVTSMAPDTRLKVSRLVLRLYAPVAARLGIYSLKHALEACAFPIAYPVDAQRIVEQVARLHAQHGEFLPPAAEALTAFLRENGVEARIEVREKQPYSIFVKMGRKSITHIGEIYDLFAFRVIVRDEHQCYQALGLLHRIGHPVPNRFKDYIGFPKPNGYQSLHTTLARLPHMPPGMFTEVQIRTEQMHREAEYGIAAHWNYKERGSHRQAPLQRMLSAGAEHAARAAPLMDHIFVLTPRGDVIELPEGATPLDFAFHVHTDLGLAFRSARVNGSIVPLEHRLENGDTVEIVKQGEPRPSPRWMTLLKTASARSRLKRYLTAKNRPVHVQRGKEICNEALAELRLPPLDVDLTLLRTIDGKPATVAMRQDFLAQVGQGSIKLPGGFGHIDGIKRERKQSAPVGTAAIPLTAQHRIGIAGGVPLRHAFAKCCRVQEERPGGIAGVIGRSGEVKIHSAECRFLRTVNPERKVRVWWES